MNCTIEKLAIMNAIAENPSIAQKALAEKISSTERTIKRRTVEMQEKGLIQRVGGKRNGYWKIKKEL